MADNFPRSDIGSIIMTTRGKAVRLKSTGSGSMIVAVQALAVVSSSAFPEGKLG
jgi:hypothetical protein